MSSLLHSHSPFRIFGFSICATLAIIAGIFMELGPEALVTTIVLILIEVTFSFENSIINAKVLAKMSRFWQNIFLTVGIVIAIFGMRIIFPIALVAISASLSWQTVLNLALNDPEAYSSYLDKATPGITSFGGAFLLMLAANFFLDRKKGVHWFGYIEKPMKRIGYQWMPYTVSFGALAILAALPMNDHPRTTLTAGLIGILTYSIVHGLSQTFSRVQARRSKVAEQTGLAAFMSFMYLEVLDASFSLDGVIGAFAITNQVLLITAGLGVGAIWVRSMTIFMVRRGTLNSFRYLEHGAFYTVSILAGVLLLESLVHIPEAIAGVFGIIIIGSAIFASSREAARDHTS